jgi:hypothetical protein
MEVLARYEVHLYRKRERMLTMLVRRWGCCGRISEPFYRLIGERGPSDEVHAILPNEHSVEPNCVRQSDRSVSRALPTPNAGYYHARAR